MLELSTQSTTRMRRYVVHSTEFNPRLRSAGAGMASVAEGFARGTAAATLGLVAVAPTILAVTTVAVILAKLCDSKKDESNRDRPYRSYTPCYHVCHRTCCHSDFSFEPWVIESAANAAGRQWNAMFKAYGTAITHFQEIVWPKPPPFTTRCWQSLNEGYRQWQSRQPAMLVNPQ